MQDFVNPFDKKLFAVKFLRNYTQTFSFKDLKKIYSSLHIHFSDDDLEFFLQNASFVLQLEDDKYITYAGAFSNEIFSIMPTSYECEKGVCVIGDRCMPFLESSKVHHAPKFYIGGKQIPKKVATFDSDNALDLFMLYGDEYASQYIALDEACDVDLAETDFALPNEVNLTGLDLDFLKKHYKFQNGDRLLCCVKDWNAMHVNIMVCHDSVDKFNRGENGEKRLEWYSTLEKCFLESFENEGPLGSIEDQIVHVIFNNRSELCVPYCGSIEEFLLKYTKKIGIEKYGVESRLWKKGEEIPCFGKWNEEMLFKPSDIDVPFADFVVFSIPPFIYDQYLLDQMFQRNNKDICEKAIEAMCCNEVVLSDETRGMLLLNLKQRSDILATNYNFFQDQEMGKVRSKALSIFGKVSFLIRKIDFNCTLLKDFPQQKLVMLSQLYSHILEVLESLYDPLAEYSDFETMMCSLEGMEYAFEDLQGDIEYHINKENISKFKIIKE